MKRSHRSFDRGRHRQQTQNRLMAGGFLILVGLGGGLVWAFYGGPAAVTAVACLLAGAGLFGLLWILLTVLELWAGREDR